MNITTPFNAEQHTRIARINFNAIWKKALRLYIVLLIATVALFVNCLVIPAEKTATDSEMFLMIFLVITVLCFGMYFKSKKQYNTALAISLSNPKAQGSSITVAITEDGVYYKTYNTEMTLQWSSFRRYRHVDGVLFLDNKLGFAITVDEKEVTPEEFANLMKLVYNKLLSI